MHLGNTGLILTDARPLALAPIYDMLPMAFRPTTGGEVLARELAIELPPPECRDDWHQAATMARMFWHEVAGARDIGAEFAGIARRAVVAVERAVARV